MWALSGMIVVLVAVCAIIRMIAPFKRRLLVPSEAAKRHREQDDRDLMDF